MKIIQEVGMETEPEVYYEGTEVVIKVNDKEFRYDTGIDADEIKDVDSRLVNGILTVEVIKDEDTDTE